MSREVEDLNRRLLRARGAMDRAYAEPLGRPRRLRGDAAATDEVTAEQLRELITKGAIGWVAFQTDDVRGLYETLKARGVTDFAQEPTDHFYGTDMGVRDPFGNAIRILQPAKVGQTA